MISWNWAYASTLHFLTKIQHFKLLWSVTHCFRSEVIWSYVSIFSLFGVQLFLDCCLGTWTKGCFHNFSSTTLACSLDFTAYCPIQACSHQRADHNKLLLNSHVFSLTSFIFANWISWERYFQLYFEVNKSQWQCKDWWGNFFSIILLLSSNSDGRDCISRICFCSSSVSPPRALFVKK